MFHYYRLGSWCSVDGFENKCSCWIIESLQLAAQC